MHIKQVDCRFKTGTDDTDALADGEFLAYPSTFTREPDCYGDVVAPGAFLESIKAWKESGNTLPVMYGHRLDDPDYNIGGVLDMGEDDHGWWIKGRFDMDSPKAAQVYRLVKEHRLSQLSFAFDVEDEGEVTLDDGTKANELRKLSVYEASFVPVGANQDTGVVAVKSATDALCDGMKDGRVLSAKNTETLRDIASELETQSKRIKDFLSEAAPRTDDKKNNQSNDATASAPSEAKDEEPTEAKSEEPTKKAESEALALAIDIALLGEERIHQ